MDMTIDEKLQALFVEQLQLQFNHLKDSLKTAPYTVDEIKQLITVLENRLPASAVTVSSPVPVLDKQTRKRKQ